MSLGINQISVYDVKDCMMLQNLHKITFASLWQLMTITFAVNLQIQVLKYLRRVGKLNPSFWV